MNAPTKNFPKEFLYYGALAALTLVLFFQRTHLGGMTLSEPLGYGGDGLVCLYLVKTMMRFGWFLRNFDVGAPGTLDLGDYPLTSDNFNMLTLKTLSLFLRDPFATINVFFISRFPICAVAAAYVFRKLNVTRASAFVGGLLFAFLPFNIIRGQGHLFVGTYYIVPFVVWLAVDALGGRLPSLSLRDRRSWLWALVCVLAAGSGIYYAYFTCALLSGVILRHLFTLEGELRWLRVRQSATYLGLITLTTVLNALPILRFRLAHGKNTEFTGRLPLESEMYGMKIIQLLLPIPNHVIGRWAKFFNKYSSTAPLVTENMMSMLGLAASVGFLILLFRTWFRGTSSEKATPEARTLDEIGFLNLGCVLLATIGGLGTVVAYFVFPEIRAYNRISIYIGFFGLLAFCLMLDAAFRRFERPMGTKTLRIVSYAALALIAAGGIVDQTGHISMNLAPAREALRSDADFVARLRAKLSPGAQVLQLPLLPFPEHPPIQGMADYEHLKLYLQESDLRWSYPAMRGRPAMAWLNEVIALPTLDMLFRAQAKGFAAIAIDRLGYEDRARRLEKELSQILGVSAQASSDGRRSFFILKLKARVSYDPQSQLPNELEIENAKDPGPLPDTIDRAKLQRRLVAFGNSSASLPLTNADLDAFAVGRSAQSLAKAPLPNDAYRGRLVCPTTLRLAGHDQADLTIVVTNLSSHWWPARSAFGDGKFGVRVRPALLDVERKVIKRDFDAPAALSDALAPGATAKVRSTIKAKDLTPDGVYLKYDLVQEGVAWFKERGGQTCVVKIFR